MKVLYNPARGSKDLNLVCFDDYTNGDAYSTKYTGMMHKTHKYILDMRENRHSMKEDVWSVFCIIYNKLFSYRMLDMPQVIWLYFVTIE